MNKKKVVACLLAATMTAGMLAGCGGSSGGSDSSSSSSGGKDKLTFWFPTFASADGEVTDEEFWNEKMDAFEKVPWQTSMNTLQMMKKQITCTTIWEISRVDSMHCL